MCTEGIHLLNWGLRWIKVRPASRHINCHFHSHLGLWRWALWKPLADRYTLSFTWVGPINGLKRNWFSWSYESSRNKWGVILAPTYHCFSLGQACKDVGPEFLQPPMKLQLSTIFPIEPGLVVGSGMEMAVPLLGVPTSVLLMQHLFLKKHMWPSECFWEAQLGLQRDF